MKLNDLAGRSFNDLSQYYIFPWTVTNFNEAIDQKFVENPSNFRNLAMPVGRINENRWKLIK